MSVVNAVAQLLAAGGDYQISRSVRLRSSASAFFNRTYASAGSATTWTYSTWVKRGDLTSATQDLLRAYYTATYHCGVYFNANGTLSVIQWTGSVAINLTTTQVFRDPSSWYHIVLAVDSTQATAANRVKLYVNGVQITSFSTATYPTQNSDTYMCSSTGWTHTVGKFYDFSTSNYFDGYLTEINFIDGQALTPASFGETDAVTGVWKPKKYAGTYGTNGFYLNFSDNSAATAAAIGKDSSGNGNNWTPNNISVTAGVTYDSMLDVPTMGGAGSNYCVLNPLDKGTATVADGNLGMSRASGGYSLVRASIGIPTTGKWYWEGTLSTSGGSGNDNIGVALASTSNSTYVGDTGSYGYQSNAIKYGNASSSSYGVSFTSGDVIGVAFDADAGTLTFYKNNSTQGVAFSSLTSGPYFPAVSAWGSTWAFNFGQRPFTYTPPTGFKALNTQNLPDGTVKAGNKYFDATTYTGTGTTQNVVNSGGFQPDLFWLKSRSNAYSHYFYDSVRGPLLSISSDATNAEQNIAQTLTSFNSNGATLGTVGGAINQNAATFVAWQWKKGAAQGFDIVTYTGNGSTQSIAHSLGVAPKMIIIKSRDGSWDWPVYHASLPNTVGMRLNLTAAQDTFSGYWNNTSPTSSAFTVGNMGSGNTNGNRHVAYLFAEVAGFSKFGSYTGNGSTDGPFVYCGFRPRFVMVKRTDTTGNWVMHDTSRPNYNATSYELYSNLSLAEGTSSGPDKLANGFKLRDTYADVNASGGTYIFAAFAENPFKNSLAR